MHPPPPQRFQDLQGLEQTVPPPRLQRTPSPALLDDSNSAYIPIMAEPEVHARRAGARTPSPSSRSPPPPASQQSPPAAKYSAWESRGHRTAQQQQTTTQYSIFPRDRSASPRHNIRPEPAARSRSPPPALEPAPLEIRNKRNQSFSRPYLQPSDAELRREWVQQLQQQRQTAFEEQVLLQHQQQQQQQQQQQRPPSRGTPATSGLTAAQLSSLNTTAPLISRKPSQDLVSPMSFSSVSSTMSSIASLTHSRKPSAGEMNLAMIGAPRPQRAPRTAVPSMCDYLSLNELEGLWAQQDLFVGSVSAPQGQRAGAGKGSTANTTVLLEPRAYVRPTYQDLGIHPAFRQQPITLGMVQ